MVESLEIQEALNDVPLGGDNVDAAEEIAIAEQMEDNVVEIVGQRVSTLFNIFLFKFSFNKHFTLILNLNFYIKSRGSSFLDNRFK